MAFDADKHVFDPKSGFLSHKDDGRPVGLVSAPLAHAHETEWPKWVYVHDSHVVRSDRGIAVPRWPEFHIDRVSARISVLVANADEETAAVSEAVPTPAAT